VYVVVTLGARGRGRGLSLLAPLVVNRRNLLAAQVVLDGTGLDVCTPLISPPARAI
jgi:flagellar assembly factor FliW